MDKAKSKRWMNGYIYPVKRIGEYPQMYFARELIGGKTKAVKLSIFEYKGQEGFSITMKKRFARLLLQRLKACLGENFNG